MLITRHFVFIHIPKTGGSFINKVCVENLPPDWLVENSLQHHSHYHAVPAEYRDLPTLCYVRNPWDWYVSWYHFMAKKDNSSEGWKARAFDFAGGDFKQIVTRACLERSLDHPIVPRRMRARDIDFFSATFSVMAGRGVREGHVEVARFERLREDFLAFLHRHEVPIDASFEALVREAPPENASRRGPYRDYYDDELRELVGEKARRLIDRYGYTF